MRGRLPPGGRGWPAAVIMEIGHSRGDAEGVRQALGRAEASVIGILHGIHGLRIAIGDAEEEEE
ncbi:hypothetical protein Shyhy02_41220 [Streptomyces hygroscopicus subsp. hygroscopicus]|nr:hypothetical protein Shyhy02_41220 [Streptomyces hygroscopicus subsp. hygroscopicus]